VPSDKAEAVVKILMQAFEKVNNMLENNKSIDSSLSGTTAVGGVVLGSKVNIYIYTYIHTYIHTYVYTYIHTYTHTYTSTHTQSYTCTIHVHLHIHIHVNILYGLKRRTGAR
jgi:hypothetical protein